MAATQSRRAALLTAPAMLISNEPLLGKGKRLVLLETSEVLVLIREYFQKLKLQKSERLQETV